jgi:hypothetical protein
MSNYQSIILIVALAYRGSNRLNGTVNDGNLYAHLFETTKCKIFKHFSNGKSTSSEFRKALEEWDAYMPSVPHVFIYAGHGAQSTKRGRPGILEEFEGNMIETDGRDEGFYMEDGTLFTDTEFGKLLKSKCPRVFITDCCHSDTIIEYADLSEPIMTVSACRDSESTPESRCKNFRDEWKTHGRLTDALTTELLRHTSNGSINLRDFVNDESSIANLTCATVRVNKSFREHGITIPVAQSLSNGSRSALSKDCVSAPCTPCENDDAIVPTASSGKVKSRTCCTMM